MTKYKIKNTTKTTVPIRAIIGVLNKMDPLTNKYATIKNNVGNGNHFI